MTRKTLKHSQLRNCENVWDKIQKIQNKLSKFSSFQKELDDLTKFQENLEAEEIWDAYYHDIQLVTMIYMSDW